MNSSTCKNGHPRTLEGTYFYKGRPIGCRICRAESGLRKQRADSQRVKDGADKYEMSERGLITLWSQIDKTGECWLFNGTLSSTGYGRFRTRYRNILAHRLVYTLLRGPIPDGLTLDHLCRVHNCVNPDHLEPVTRGENVLRGMTGAGINKRKTYCKRGHPFDEINTYIAPDGARHCRRCARERRRIHP